MAATALADDTRERIGPQEGPQTEFLQCNADVAFYGGSAGGGKTWALLLEALYDIHRPNFGAVIFRRTMKQVTNEGGLWDTAEELYSKLGATQNKNEHCFTFPSGATVTFAHMQHEKNRIDHQGSQIALACYDELTHFTWKMFSYLSSRSRSMSGANTRIRATMNPDPDHWVRRFIDWWIGDDGFAIPERSGVIRYYILLNDEVIWRATKEELLEEYEDCEPISFTFIRSSVYDNKAMLRENPKYLAFLKSLPYVERCQLLDGNWDVRPSAGTFFQRSNFEIVEAVPPMLATVRAWDQAGTQADQEDPDDPDWSVGAKMGIGVDGYFYILHVERFRKDPRFVDAAIKNTASQDGPLTAIRLTQDPGSAGKALAQSQARMLAGYYVNVETASGDKEHRAKPFSAQAQVGNVRILKGDWNDAFLNELEAFPLGRHDDQVDSASDAFNELTGQGSMIYTTSIHDILVEPFDIPAHWPRIFSIEVDHGRTAALWGAWDKTVDCLYIYTEDAREKVDPAVTVAGVQARGDWIPGVFNPMARGRSKEDGERMLWEYVGFGLKLSQTDNATEAGIKAVQDRLSTGRIKVFKTLDRFGAEYRLYRRDENGKIAEKFDLLMDCLRNIVASYRSIAKHAPVSKGRTRATVGDRTVGY